MNEDRQSREKEDVPLQLPQSSGNTLDRIIYDSQHELFSQSQEDTQIRLSSSTSERPPKDTWMQESSSSYGTVYDTAGGGGGREGGEREGGGREGGSGGTENSIAQGSEEEEHHHIDPHQISVDPYPSRHPDRQDSHMPNSYHQDRQEVYSPTSQTLIPHKGSHDTQSHVNRRKDSDHISRSDETQREEEYTVPPLPQKSQERYNFKNSDSHFTYTQDHVPPAAGYLRPHDSYELYREQVYGKKGRPIGANPPSATAQNLFLNHKMDDNDVDSGKFPD